MELMGFNSPDSLFFSKIAACRLIKPSASGLAKLTVLALNIHASAYFDDSAIAGGSVG